MARKHVYNSLVAALRNPLFYWFDEPIAPLDPYYQIDMMEQLQSLTPQHTCVVAIHHLSLAYQFCDEICSIR